MTDVPDDPSENDDHAPDETHVDRGARAARVRAKQKLKAPEPKTPAFEETFAAEENSDAGEPPTSIWTDSVAENVSDAELSDESLSGSDEPTRALQDIDLSEHTPAPQPAQRDPHAWYLGRSFGGFRIVRAIASGGMATVFLARKEGPARVSKHAAIKVVHPHLAYEREFVHMFLDEARIAALIDHPNVCHVLDFGMAEGTYYLAMEYLLGETWSTVRSALAEHPDGARMVPAVSAHVLAQACDGLYAAHEAQDDNGHPLSIVHRDISPQNIFVAYDGTVRVLDFGIARAADRITSTRDGVLKGRLAYMSPEQMSIAEVGPAADIWSIGVVLREALEGKRLFRRASDAETMLAVTQEPLPAWSEGVPESLRAICDRALARNPRERQASARVLARELLDYAQSSQRQVGSSDLSVWMGLLFAAEMEQKRALLQLPMPEPRAGGTPLPPPPLEEAEPSEASMPARGPSTQPARPESRKSSLRPAWLNPPALVALGSVGAIVGMLLGRVLHRDPLHEGRLHSAQTEAQREPAKPTVDQREPPKPVVDQLAAPEEKPVVSQLAPSEVAAPTVTPLAEATEVAVEARAQDDARGKASEQNPVRTAEPPPSQAPRPTPALPAPSQVAPRGTAREPNKSPQRAPTSATKATGTVLVAFAGGWAEVSLGGKRLGTTPGRFVVPAGKQTLSVRPFGTGKPFAKRVELAPDQVLKVFLTPP